MRSWGRPRIQCSDIYAVIILQYNFHLTESTLLINCSCLSVMCSTTIDMTRDFRLPPRSSRECALLACYTASSGEFLPTFRDNLSVPSARSLPHFTL